MPLAPPAGWGKFISQVLENKPAKIVEHPREACHTFIDASSWGLGIICVGPRGERHHFRREWTEAGHVGTQAVDGGGTKGGYRGY